jgi:hypothetical protein
VEETPVEVEETPVEVEETPVEVEETPVEVEETPSNTYKNNLYNHMDKYRHDKWYDIIRFVFSYQPSIDNNHSAISYVNKIPNRPLFRLYQKQCNSWLNSKQDRLRECVKNSLDFLKFIIDLRNFIQGIKNQQPLTKQQVLTLYHLEE